MLLCINKKAKLIYFLKNIFLKINRVYNTSKKINFIFIFKVKIIKSKKNLYRLLKLLIFLSNNKFLIICLAIISYYLFVFLSRLFINLFLILYNFSSLIFACRFLLVFFKPAIPYYYKLYSILYYKFQSKL